MQLSDSNWTSLEIDEFWQGERLDVFLFRYFDFFSSRNFAAKWIDAGHVRVSRSIPKPGFRLRTGDRVDVCLTTQSHSDEEPLAEPMALEILFEDNDLIVINKPSGLVVHPGAGVSSGTLVNGLFAHCGQTLPSLGPRARAGIVHRLDRDTSGVMVVAKSQKALTELSAQFAAHSQVRKYSAICYGVPDDESFSVESGYGRDPRSRTRFSVLPTGAGKRAATKFKVLRTFGARFASEIECSLETGRTHQIRVHLTHLGFPLIGDPVYGQQPVEFSRTFPQCAAWIRKSISGQLLHAKLLGFKHPVTGVPLTFSTDLRLEMLQAVERLEELKPP